MDVGDDVNDQVDAAYRTKYRYYAANIIGAITSPEARPADDQTRAAVTGLPSVREPRHKNTVTSRPRL